MAQGVISTADIPAVADCSPAVGRNPAVVNYILTEAHTPARARIGRRARWRPEPRHLVAVSPHAFAIHDVILLLKRHLRVG